MKILSHLKLPLAFFIGAGLTVAVMRPWSVDHRSSDSSPQPEASHPKSLPTAAAQPNFPSTTAAARTTSSSDRLPTQARPENLPQNAADLSSSTSSAIAPTLSPNRSAFAAKTTTVEIPSAANATSPGTQSASTSQGNHPSTPTSESSPAGSYGGSASPASVGGNSYAAVAPMPGGGGYASAPTTGGGATAPPTVEIGPEASIPASLAPPNPAAKLTPEEQSLANDLGQQFVDTVGTNPPTDPASADAWNQAQKHNDELYKLYFGYQAYNVQSAAAYRASLQTSGTGQ